METLADGDTVVKQKLFCDESTCESFFRRLSWTTDGAYLVCPAALWHPQTTTTTDTTTTVTPQQDQTNAPPSFSTFLFARHRFDEPCKVLSGVE
jgi:chromatin assembly factor 1 subunit B